MVQMFWDQAVTRNNCVTNLKLLNTMLISWKFIFLGIIAWVGVVLRAFAFVTRRFSLKFCCFDSFCSLLSRLQVGKVVTASAMVITEHSTPCWTTCMFSTIWQFQPRKEIDSRNWEKVKSLANIRYLGVKEVKTAVATTTPQINELIGWTRKNSRATRGAIFLVQFFDGRRGHFHF